MYNSAKRVETILIVDDSMLNRALLADMLDDNYNILEAEDGEQAIALLQKEGMGISLVLLDYVMPKMDGFGVLEIMAKNGWLRTIPVIMVSSENDPGYIEKAYDLGVTDFISRPYDVNIVRRRIMNTLMLYQKQRSLIGMVMDEVQESERSNNLMVAILAHIVEFRNGESGPHVLNVQAITSLLLMQLYRMAEEGLAPYELTIEDVSLISLASCLHDIGKITLPENILNKPGPFTEEEFEIMKTHAAAGAHMLDTLSMGSDEKLVHYAREICHWHHERYDGRGYPDGLKGDQIPLAAQVVALADVYDALTSKRVYKPALSHESAVDMILKGDCGSFSPLLLECLKAVEGDLEARIHNGIIGMDKDAPLPRVEFDFDGTTAASSRTLKLLDYERIKFHFYAAMSNEVQFEFTEDPLMIVLNDWSKRKLNLPEVIMDPYNNEEFLTVIGRQKLLELHDALRNTTPDAPVIDYDVVMKVHGEERWMHVVAQAMWSQSEPYEYLGSIGKFVDIDDQQMILQDLQHKAYHDPLTDICNTVYAHRLINEKLKRNAEEAAENRHQYILMLCDLDLFKDANDNFGHQFGDEVLKHFAHQLAEGVRADDVVARVGGDEFLLFLKSPANPASLVERVHKRIEGSYEGFGISVSMGVACTSDGAEDYETLFRHADIALYHKKRTGRSGYVFYQELTAEERGLLDDGELTALSDMDSEEENH
jgi:putative two-component system response regulator